MSSLTAPALTLTVDEWHDAIAGREDGHWELVDGRAVLSPTESVGNITVAMILARLLADTAPAHRALPNCSVELSPAPTVRVPDVALVRAAVDPRAWLVRASDLVLVVEVVSPGSREVDWIHNRAEYAAAGIPNYVIVDVTGEPPRIWLFDTILDSAGAADYADPTGDGSSVTLHLDGHDLTIAAHDLRP